MIKSKCFVLPSNSTFKVCLFSFVIIFYLSACYTFYTKEKYFTDFNNFVTETEQYHYNYTTSDWENSDYEYSQFTTELYQKIYNELTSDDQQQIGKLKARYQKVKLKSDIKETIQSIKNGVNQTLGIIENVIDSINLE